MTLALGIDTGGACTGAIPVNVIRAVAALLVAAPGDTPASAAPDEK